MKARITGQDYFLFFSGTEEFESVKKGPLKASLQEKGKDLGKLVTLTFGGTVDFEGIDLFYEPKNPASFDDIKAINVTINDKAYNRVLMEKQFGTRYDGANKVSVVINEY